MGAAIGCTRSCCHRAIAGAPISACMHALHAVHTRRSTSSPGDEVALDPHCAARGARDVRRESLLRRELGVAIGGYQVPGIDAPDLRTLDALTGRTKKLGAAGLVWIRVGERGALESPVGKYLSEAEQLALSTRAPRSTGPYYGDARPQTILRRATRTRRRSPSPSGRPIRRYAGARPWLWCRLASRPVPPSRRVPACHTTLSERRSHSRSAPAKDGET